MIAIVLIVVAVIAIVFLYNQFSVQTVEDVKKEDNIGKSVTVNGEVKTVIKIGQLSGYTLEDETGTIAVSSDDLPQEGEMITVRGTLIRDTLFGYYIKTN